MDALARQGGTGGASCAGWTPNPGWPREGEGPDRWGPPVGGREAKDAVWARKKGVGPGRGIGLERGWEEEKRKKKGKEGESWAGLKIRREKGKLF